MFISLVKSEDEIGLLVGTGNNIVAFHTLQEGLDYYEKGYQAKHAQSYEGSMSALLNNMAFSPSIYEFADLEDIIKTLFDGDTTNTTILTRNHISGRVTVALPKNTSAASDCWDLGSKPRLI